MFEIGKKYTVFTINSFASTSKLELTVTRFDENGNPIYKIPHKRKEFILRLKKQSYQNSPIEEFDGAVFENWNQPITCDTDTKGKPNANGTICSHWRGNALFNFVGNTTDVKSWIDNNQLNPSFKKYKVCAINENDVEEIAYPELYKGNHAVIDRMLNK